MIAHISRFDESGRARITQLINKTNQFNLTTQRYSESDVAAFESDRDVLGLQVRLQDRFGDNGMISVVICRRDGADWLIDTWLMSCRVLNRRLEEQVLNIVHASAREQGIRRLIGMYRPTAKNGMVKDHYRKLGFTLASESETLVTWMLDVGDYVPRAVPIAITVGTGLDAAAQAISVLHADPALTTITEN
jgi:FkbH-like protein